LEQHGTDLFFVNKIKARPTAKKGRLMRKLNGIIKKRMASKNKEKTTKAQPQPF
jgi:hypothetical protein